MTIEAAGGPRRRGRGAAALGLVVFQLAIAAGAQESAETGVLRQAWRGCREIEADDRRLACYDRLRSHFEPPRFQGRLSATTPLFAVEHRALLRYQSDGPIFVMYLEDEHGNVVQNLHLGGGGEASWMIEGSGAYRLEVSGSDSWRIWVEPAGEPGS